MTRSRLVKWVTLVACTLMPTYTPAVSARSAQELPVIEAVWKMQQVSFAYRSQTTMYSCSSLHDKVRDILMTVGARDNIVVRFSRCDDMTGIAQLHITFESPVEATPQNVRDITDYDSREQLIARLRGTQLTSATDLPRFAATWKSVSFSRERKLKLGPGDCELVQQLRREVLPMLSVRIVRDRLWCSPSLGNIGLPRLTVAALVSVPPAEPGDVSARGLSD